MGTPVLATLLHNVFLKCEGEDHPIDWINNKFPWYINGRRRYIPGAGREKFHTVINTSKDQFLDRMINSCFIPKNMIIFIYVF